MTRARELTDLLDIIPAARALRKRFRLARIHVVASEGCASALANRSEVFAVSAPLSRFLPFFLFLSFFVFVLVVMAA